MTLEVAQREAADQLNALVKRKPKPVKRTGLQGAKIYRDIEKAAAMAKNENLWKKFNAPLLVALYAWLHKQVYDVDVVNEIEGTTGLGARQAAKSMLTKEFDGNCEEMLVFMRWVWYREREREKWRVANNRHGGFRIGWRYQFSPGLVNEYRIAKRRFEPNFGTKTEDDYGTVVDNHYSLGT